MNPLRRFLRRMSETDEERLAEEVLALGGHKASVNDICAVPGAGGGLLASVSDDRTVRLWDVTTGTAVRSIPVHHIPLACCYAAGTLIIGLDAGIMAIALAE